MAEHDDDDTDISLEALPVDEAAFPDPRLAISVACLKRTIPAPVLARLRSSRFRIVVIEVPGDDWITWVCGAAKEVLPNYPCFSRSNTRTDRRSADAEMSRFAGIIAMYGRVVAVIETDRVPDEIRHVADHSFKLAPPDRSALREVARRVLVGDAARIRSVPDTRTH